MIKKLFLRSLPSILIISLTILSCGSQTDVHDLISNKESLDMILDHYVKKGLDPVIYARLEDIDGDVLYEHSAVNRNLLPSIEVNGQTWFRIWSMSKIITITIALDLVEDGILSLNEPVTEYIPEFENLKVAVTKEGEILSEINSGNTEGACPFELVPTDSVITVSHLINHEAGKSLISQ